MTQYCYSPDWYCFDVYYSAPDVPGFGIIEPGNDYINVSWVPTDKGPTKNPGSEFYVEYRKVSDGK